MLELKNTRNEECLALAEERTSELRAVLRETSKAKMQRRMKKNHNVQKPWDNYKQCNTCNGNPGKRRKKGTEARLEVIKQMKGNQFWAKGKMLSLYFIL